MCAAYLSGDPWLLEIEGSETPISGSDRAMPPEIIDPAALDLVHRGAIDAIRHHLLEGPRLPEMTRERFHPLLEMFFGRAVPTDEVDYWWEEFGAERLSRAVQLSPRAKQQAQDFEVAIFGAGMNGLAAAIHLKEAGIPFVILEKNHDVGGTWLENTYPGARVDVASLAYSYSFEPDYPWQHHYATQPELLAYFRHCAEKYDLRPHIRFGSEVTGAEWSEASGTWTIEISTLHGPTTLDVRAIISAVGLFNRPKLADIAGLIDFEGLIVHTACWDHDIDLTGKRVAVVGTGSSGVQIVGPLSEVAEHLTIFQRTGTWIADVPDYYDPVASDEEWLREAVPYYRNWSRLLQVYGVGDARASLVEVDPGSEDPDWVNQANWELRRSLMANLRRHLAGRDDLLAKCTPAYPPLAKRLPKDNGWLEAVTKPHVDLVVEPIEAVTSSAIRTTDGKVHEADVIVLATGFNATKFLWPMRIRGRSGTLEEAWSQDGARAYLGILIPEFPNLFCLYGPNTNPRAGTPISWGEMQVRYAVQCIELLLCRRAKSVAVRSDVCADFNRRMDERLSDLVWMDPRQDSYFRNEFGRVVTNSAWLNAEYWAWTRRPMPQDLIFS